MIQAPEFDNKNTVSSPCAHRLMVRVLLLSAAMIVAAPATAQETNTLLRQSLDGENIDGMVVGSQTVPEYTVTPESPAAPTAIFGDSLDGEDGSATTTDERAANAAPMPLVTGSTSNTNARAIRTPRQDPVGSPGSDGQFNTRSNTRASTVEGGVVTGSTDPYAALGLRLGTFDLFPTLDQSIGYSSNADAAQNGSSSTFSETAVGLRVQSNWARHSLQAELGATYQRFFNGGAEAVPTANASSTLRLDVGQEYTITLRGGYSFSTENATSANLVTPGAAVIIERPATNGFTTSAELARTEGKLRFSLRGSLARTIYEDANLSDGTKLFQGDRDNLLASVTGRASYQISPAVTPFIESTIGKRLYYIKVDSNGNRRDSDLYALRGGLELDFGEKLTGQLGIGYTVENFKDVNINTLGAVTLDGSLNWSPVRLTQVTASASTTLSPSANTNDNGSVIYSGSLGISRQVRPQLNLNANLTATIQDYDTTGRRDTTVGINAGYTYWFNRYLAATGQVSYENINSTDPTSSYDVGTIRLGLRIQR